LNSQATARKTAPGSRPVAIAPSGVEGSGRPFAGYEAILFDFDGVLVDSEPLHYECWVEVVGRFGLPLSWDEYRARCIGVSDRAMIQALCDIRGRPDLFDGIWALYPEKQRIFRERIVENVPMPEATRQLLASLGGLKLAVVSSSGRTEVEPPLAAAGVAARFATMVCGGDVRQLKPSPEPYLLAASRLSVSRALVVEDSDAGCASGRAAGFDVVRVDRADRTAELVRAKLEQR
jgi:beta-phosphoglucomutase